MRSVKYDPPAHKSTLKKNFRKTTPHPIEIWQQLIGMRNNDHLHLVAIHQEAHGFPAAGGAWGWPSLAGHAVYLLLQSLHVNGDSVRQN